MKINRNEKITRDLRLGEQKKCGYDSPNREITKLWCLLWGYDLPNREITKLRYKLEKFQVTKF